MKMTIQSLVLFLPLLLLQGCGGGGSTTKLEVTNGFQVSNAGFDGGLVVVGKSSAGVFSKYITSGTTFSVSLPKASWEFSAVGWYGPDKAKGQAYCGNVSVNLANDQESVTINVDSANCSNSKFGLPAYFSSNTFLPLQLLTCKTLHETPASIASVNASTPDTFCDGLAIDMQGSAKSAKVTILQKDLAGQFTPSTFTNCAATGGSNPISFYNNLPTKTVPVRIELFSNSTCIGTPKYAFDMKDGLASVIPGTNFDRVVVTNGTSTRVFLPYNDLRKGWSPFYLNLPELKCAGECVPGPVSGVPTNMVYIYSNTEFQDIKIAEEGFTCNDVTEISGTNLNIGSCRDDEEDGLYLQVEESTQGVCASSCTLSYKLAGTAQSLTLTSNNTYSDDLNLYENLWRLLGSSQTPSSFFRFYDRKDELKGRLSSVREMLGPAGAGGVFGNTDCSTASGLKYVTLFEDGTYKNYQAEIQDGTSRSIPNYICNATDSRATCGGASFQKKLIVRELLGGIYQTQETIYLTCSSLLGLSESFQVEVDGTESRKEKSLTAWNTADQNFARVESIRTEEVFVSGTHQLTRTSFERVEKANAIEDFLAQSYHFESKRISTNLFQERLSQREYYKTSATDFNSYETTLEQNTATSGALFDNTYFNQAFLKPTETTASAYSQNNSGHIAVAWVKTYNSKKRLYLSRFNNTTKTWSHPQDDTQFISGSGDDVESVSLTLTNSGKIVLAYQALNPSTLNVMRVVGDITTPLPWAAPTIISIITNATSAMNGSVSTCATDTEAAVVWVQVTTSPSGSNIFTSFTTDYTNWTTPTTSSHGLFSTAGGEYQNNIRCTFGDGKLVIAFRQTSPSVKIFRTQQDVASLSYTALGANILEDFSPDVTSIQLKTSGTSVILQGYDNVTQNILKTRLTSSNWYPETSSSARYVEGKEFCRPLSGSFPQTTQTCSPATTIPHFSSAIGNYNFGALRLKPTTIGQAFMIEPDFKAQ